VLVENVVLLLEKYLDEAISMCPSDHSSLHMRGRWAYHVAGLSMLDRIAAVLYATPPTATFAAALANFLEIYGSPGSKQRDGDCSRRRRWI
jgi:hypothetical protein